MAETGPGQAVACSGASPVSQFCPMRLMAGQLHLADTRTPSAAGLTRLTYVGLKDLVLICVT